MWFNWVLKRRANVAFERLRKSKEANEPYERIQLLKAEYNKRMEAYNRTRQAS